MSKEKRKTKTRGEKIEETVDKYVQDDLDGIHALRQALSSLATEVQSWRETKQQRFALQVLGAASVALRMCDSAVRNSPKNRLETLAIRKLRGSA